MPLLELSRISCEGTHKHYLTYTAQTQTLKLYLRPETYIFRTVEKLSSAVMPYFLGHLVRVVQRVFPLQEHPLLLGAGQATGEPCG